MISFMICGAQKSGTSALHEYLREHPEIDLPKTKELHIFDDENRDWSTKGIKEIDRTIEKYFESDEIDKVKGEATPASMWWRPAMGRIWQYNPNMKLIAVLRNPIERAYANWKMEVYKGREKGKMHTTLKEEEKKCRSALPQQDKIHSYLSRGFYSEQIRRIWEYFPRENLLLIKQEELLKEPEEILHKIYIHLNVGKMALSEKKKVISWNSLRGGYKHKENVQQEEMTKEIKKSLIRVYRREIQVLEDMTGWDCSSWKR